MILYKHLPFALLFMLGCNQTEQVLKWHQSASSSKTLVDNVSVKGYSFPIETSAQSKDAWSLAERGQKAYIEALATNAEDNAALRADLARPITATTPKTRFDLTTFTKQVVLSVKHDRELPCDRIDRLNIHLKLPHNAEVAFTYWDKLATNWGTVDLGSLSYTDTFTASFQPSINLLGTIEGTLGTPVGVTKALTEELTLSRRFIVVNGTLSPTEADLFLQGAPFRDLDGNVVATVVMKANKAKDVVLYQGKGLFGANGDPQDTTKAQLLMTMYSVPALSSDITAELSYDVRTRVVTNTTGRATVNEGDDEVEYRSNGNKVVVDQVELVDREEFAFREFIITGPAGDLHAKDPLHTTLLAFSSMEAAEDVLRWMVLSGSTKLGSIQICKDDLGTPLSKDDLDKCRIEQL